MAERGGSMMGENGQDESRLDPCAALRRIATVVSQHHFKVATGEPCERGTRNCDQCLILLLVKNALEVSPAFRSDLESAAASIEGKSGVAEEEEALARRLRGAAVAMQEKVGRPGPRRGPIDWGTKPLQRSLSPDAPCELCPEQIVAGQLYRRHSADRKAHESCVEKRA